MLSLDYSSRIIHQQSLLCVSVTIDNHFTYYSALGKNILTFWQ